MDANLLTDILNEEETSSKLVSVLMAHGLKVGIYPKKNEKAVDIKVSSKLLYLPYPARKRIILRNLL